VRNRETDQSQEITFVIRERLVPRQLGFGPNRNLLDKSALASDVTLWLGRPIVKEDSRCGFQ
jgi:hypothetical protein